MPEAPFEKHKPHPWKARGHTGTPAHVPCPHRYAELAVTSNFTFLTGASHPEELVQAAAAMGHAYAAIADLHTLAGVVRAHVAAKEAGIGLAVGTRVTLSDPRCLDASMPGCLLLFPTDRDSYGRLCRLLTTGKRRVSKGECHLTLHDVIEFHEGLQCVVVPPALEAMNDDYLAILDGIARVFREGDRLSIAACRDYGADDHVRLARIEALCLHLNVPMAAANDVLYHDPSRRELQDVLTCIRHGCTLDEAGLRLRPSAERCLKPPDEMARLFADYPHALTRSVEIAERSARGFNLDQLKYEYADEVVPPGKTPMGYLTELVWDGVREKLGEMGKWPSGEVAKWQSKEKPSDFATLPLCHSATPVSAQILHELRLIDELNYAPYFLTVYDLVRFARSRGILCQGRGAAANSAVCYFLGVTSVDPQRIDLLFERFVSKERDEPPDIDIDFEHERREEVIQYIYGKYGRERAALTAEVITYRGRSAIREVGKALGLSLDCVDRLAKELDWWDQGLDDQTLDRSHETHASHETSHKPNLAARLRDLGINPDDPTIVLALRLAREILGFPRHLSQHVGGFVITRGPLCESVPIENARMPDRTVIEWDKNDIDALGMLKVDVLGLGMLTCIRRAFEFVNRGLSALPPLRGSGVLPPFTGGSAHPPAADSLHPRLQTVAPPGPSTPIQLHTIPAEDPVVYDMICRADTIGVFQIESRAQMSMLPRLKPRCFYDLVIEVAIVRPGPIVGDMVHPYLKRRNGQEKVEYPDEAVKAVLGKTLGVPLFQEQAMKLAMVAAGFTAGEADQLRRAIAAWKSKQKVIHGFGRKIIDGMTSRGYAREFAERCFEQLKGFSEYGFPESHAASFALLVYASAWLKCYYPAEFAAALINSQPMGFYAPAQIVRDAKEHGVEVYPADVNLSGWDCRIESPEGAKVCSRGWSEAIEDRRAEPPAIESAAREPRRGDTADLRYSHAALRLGTRLVDGLPEMQARIIEQAVTLHGPFTSITALWHAAGVKVSTLRKLAHADAFTSMGLDRQRALWEVRSLKDESLPLFDECLKARKHEDTEAQSDNPTCLSAPVPLCLPPISPLRHVMHDYHATGLSLKAHPVSFMREQLAARGVTPNAALSDQAAWKHGSTVAVCGLVLVRQRPGTASGVVFMTIEDETGVANLILWPQVYQRFRKAARHSVTVIARGRVQREGEVVHVLVRSITNAGDGLPEMDSMSRDFR